MESVMANQVDEKQWYIAVGERSLGPLSTDLVTRGIRSGKVPTTAWVCQVGDSSWSAISSFGEFHDALNFVLGESTAANEAADGLGAAETAYDAEPPEDETSQVEPRNAISGFAASSTNTSSEATPEAPVEEEETGQRALLPYERPEMDAAVDGGFEPTQPSYATGYSSPSVDHSALGPAEVAAQTYDNPFAAVFGADVSEPSQHNSYSDISEQRPVEHAAVQGAAHDDDLGIDITFDEDHANAIDWMERFQSYFLVGAQVELPDEQKLLQSLYETPRSTFLHDEALWNLALCLAFGTDAVAAAGAAAFYGALRLDSGAAHAQERIEWIGRTLLSKGFMPSGIPRLDGMRGIDVLREACPPELQAILEREAAS